MFQLRQHVVFFIVLKFEDSQEQLLHAVAQDDLESSRLLVRPCDLVDAESQDHIGKDEDNASDDDSQGNLQGSTIDSEGSDDVEDSQELCQPLTHPEQEVLVQHVQSLPQGVSRPTCSEIDAIVGREDTLKDVYQLGAEVLDNSSPQESRGCRMYCVYVIRDCNIKQHVAVGCNVFIHCHPV